MADTIATAYVTIEPSMAGVAGKLKSGLGDASASAGQSAGKSFGSGFASVAGSIGKVATAAIGAATTAVTGFAASSVSVGQAFDQSMSQVAATMGVTTAEIGELRDFAQEMGSTTAFSATEAADALNYMALAGYDADTSMKMLPNVLNLAAAGGIDLASASDMVTDAQTALGLSIEETSTMVDQMAKASSSSNTSVQQLGDAFLTIGANARNVKGGTQELSTVLGVLADNGIKGSEAGTHLRNIMLSLTPATDKAAAAWEELGVQAYDADGNLRDLPTIFQELNDSMDGWSDEDRTAQLSAMFNKTDLASINALLETSSKRWDELSDKIGEADGAAAQMAETQLDNLAGDVTLFKSALEGAQIVVSDGLTPTLREFVSFGSEGLSTITAAFKEGGLSGAMEAFGTVLSDGLNMVIEMIPQVIDMGAQLLGALGEGLLNNVDTLASAAINIVTMLIQYFFEALPEIATFAVQFVSSLASSLGSALPTLIPVIVEGVMNMIAALTDPANITMLVEGAIALVQGLADGILAAIPILIQQMPVIIQNVVNSIVQSLPLLIDGILTLVQSLVEALPDIIMALVEALPQIIEAIVNGLIEALPMLIEGAIQLVIMLVTHLPEIIMALIQAIPQIIMSILNAFGPIGEGLCNLFSKAWDGIKNVFSNVGGWFSEKFSQAKEMAGNAWSGIKDKFAQSWEQTKAGYAAAGEWFSNTFSNAKEMAANAWSGIKDKFAQSWEQTKAGYAAAGEWFSKTFGDARDKAATAWSSIKDKMSQSWETTKSVFSTVGDWFKNKFTDAKNNTVNAWSNIKEKFSGIWSKIKDGFKLDEALTWGKDMISNFIGGIKEKWNALKDTVADIGQSIKDFLGFSVPKMGPLSDADTWMPDMMQLFAKGIKDNDYLVTDQIEQSFDFMHNFTPDEPASNDNGEIVSLLRQIAQGNKVNITLDGDAGRLFRLMQRESVRNTQLVGVNSVLAAT